MKKLLIVALSLGLGFAASAQRGGHVMMGGGYRYVPRVSVGVGYYSPYYWGLYGPYAYGAPYFWGYPGYGRPMSKLDRKVEDIKMDYADKIRSAKEDTSLTHRQRRQTIRQLKADRDQEIHDLRANYYKQ